MEQADTQPHPGWGNICCDCMYVFDDDKKYIDFAPSYPCKRMKWQRHDGTLNPIFGLTRWIDGSETCDTFKKFGCFEEDDDDVSDAVPFKRWFFIRHIRFLYLNWKFNRWWKNVGSQLGMVPNQADLDYLMDVWRGKR